MNLCLADGGDLAAIASDASFYILKYNVMDEQGVDDAFELLHEVIEQARTGICVGDCFIYNNSSWCLNYCVGGRSTQMLQNFWLDPVGYLNSIKDQQVALAMESDLAHKRDNYPCAVEYLSYADKSNINPVEDFKSTKVDEEDVPLENEDPGHEVIEENGVVEGHEKAVEVEADDSTDGAILVNGNDGEEEWCMKNEGAHQPNSNWMDSAKCRDVTKQSFRGPSPLFKVNWLAFSLWWYVLKLHQAPTWDDRHDPFFHPLKGLQDIASPELTTFKLRVLIPFLIIHLGY